jgi:hypothetical protein
MSSYLNDKTRSRGLRNNNPLNIRKTAAKWTGKISDGADKEFEQFISLELGLRAGAINIRTQINQRGNSGRNGRQRRLLAFETTKLVFQE